MVHNSKCANAKRPECTCECGGAGHGCQGAFEIADGPLDGVLANRDQRESDWNARPRPSKLTAGQAAIACAQADVIHWLHRDRDLLKCVRAAQAAAFEADPIEATQGMVLQKVVAHLGACSGEDTESALMDDFQKWARKKHFWCELLAQMVCVLAQYEKLRNRVFRLVEDVLQQRWEESLPDRLRGTGVIGAAVQWAWRYVLANLAAATGAASLAALLAAGDVHRLIWPIRIIAVLMCPDADDHPTVREHCLKPILALAHAEAHEVIRDIVRQRLAAAFPDDSWFDVYRNASGTR